MWALIVAWICVLLLGGMITLFVLAMEKTQEFNAKHNAEALKDFKSKISKKIGSYTFLISEDYTEMIAKYNGTLERKLPKRMKIENIIGCEIVQDNATVKQYGIGRAIAGSVLAGGAGAIVGTLTAKELQQAQKIELKFKTNDVHNPIERFVVYKKGIDKGIDNILEQCDELVATIELLIQQNNNKNM